MSVQRRLLPTTGALAAFEAVARLGSFTAAAQELALTQGAISRQIKLLEDQFGKRLIERDSRIVQLSPEGEIYAETVRAALGQLREAALGLMSNRHGGVLNLAILPTFGTRWLMPLIPEFVEQNPDITIWAVEPKNAAILAGGTVSTHVQMGIGDGVIPTVLNQGIYEGICIVSDDMALRTARRLATEEGIMCGIYSGTNVAAVLRMAKALGPGKTVVTVLPDTAERYFSTPLFE